MKYPNNIDYISARKLIKWSLVYPLIVGAVLLMPPLKSVQAQKYNPPQGEPPGGVITSTGSRDSCSEEYELPLTGLAPTVMNHVGRTATTTPTLAWFVPSTKPYRISFSLYTANQEELLQQVEYIDDTPEIVSFTVSAEDVTLEPGQRYIWEVNLVCNPANDAYEQFFISEFDVILPSEDLAVALATAQTPLEKAALYAESGYWYDALQAALSLPEGARFIQSLLSDLAATEAEPQSQYLSEIAELIHD